MSKKEKITAETVRSAYETLKKYKSGKASVENRIIENEQWWKLRCRNGDKTDVMPSPWLFNTIVNRHADAMDNMPDVVCLPREEGDRESARLMSKIIPVLLEENSFENTYSECWYDKLKSGTACYGVFWNPSLDGGAGNVDIRRIDILNLFWEPGISHISRSKNVFHVELWDNSVLFEKYPALRDTSESDAFETAKYIYDDAVDTSDKSAVVDWYYKKHSGGRDILHFCKFCNGVLLYASENDPRYESRGFYDHGKYPFFFDKLYSVQGTPCGMGVIDMMKGTQAQIDALGTAIVKNARMAASRRFFIRGDGSINEKEFADWSSPFVHYQGSGDPNSSVMPIEMPLLSATYVSVLNSKIEELKETSGNRDFSQGIAGQGVTAAAAIEALQEAGSKTSRDTIYASYRVLQEICAVVIKLIKQFYTVPRCFRITGEGGAFEFSYCGKESLEREGGGEPVFDIKIRAEKKSAFSRASINELACRLYEMGMFSPELSQQAQLCLSMMEFEGKDALLAKIREAAGEVRGL